MNIEIQKSVDTKKQSIKNEFRNKKNIFPKQLK